MSRNKLAEEWGKVKFVPKIRKRPGNNSRFGANAATPWKHFKNKILEKQREETNSNAVNMNSNEAQEMLKKREQNYRRNLITSQAKQPAKWENFEDDNDKKMDEQKKRVHPQKIENLGIDLNNYDAKKLTFKQNNTLRKIITKGIMLEGTNLRLATQDMELKKQKKNLKKSANIDSKKLEKLNDMLFEGV